MDPSIYKKAKEIFLAARELNQESREAFISEKAEGKAEIEKAVHLLLKNDREETILTRDALGLSPEVIDPLGLTKIKGHKKQSALSQVIFNSRGRTGIAYLILAIAIALVGIYAARQTKQYLVEMRANETMAILKSNVEALNFWIKEYQQSTRMAIGDKETLEAIETLLDNPENKHLHLEVDSLINPYLGPRASEFIVTDLTGQVIASPHERFIGTRINSRFGKEIYAAASGEEQFVLPFYPETDRANGQLVPLVWMHIPVINQSGKIIATFGIGREADEDFTRILRTARNGKTGETYAIDREGVFISESRYEQDLRKAGRLPEDTMVSSILNLQARNFSAAPDSAIQTLTDLAVQVVACAQTQSPVQSGVLTQPTIDYRGVEVIGAWMWLPNYGFGVITQVDAAEAFSPARYIYILILVSISLLLIASFVSFYNASELYDAKKMLRSVAELGQYELKKIIQAGGMGTVYLAQHKLMKRPTAIKVVRVDKEDMNLSERFEREVKLASQLVHPNTIEIFDYGFTKDDQPYYAMEYLNGVDLAEVVKLSGALPPGRVVHIMNQVCASLHEAHTLGLVHRDIKPKNIMLVNKIGLHDFVKVLDFGLAKPFVQQSSVEDTRVITGTPVYIAPERLKQPSLADPAADIYAIGALMYYLLSGHAMFEFSSDLDILYRVLNDNPEPLPDSVPLHLRNLTMFCLEKDPENRPTSIEEVKLFLMNLAEEFPWPAEDASLWWKKFVQ